MVNCPVEQACGTRWPRWLGFFHPHQHIKRRVEYPHVRTHVLLGLLASLAHWNLPLYPTYTFHSPSGTSPGNGGRVRRNIRWLVHSGPETKDGIWVGLTKFEE